MILISIDRKLGSSIVGMLANGYNTLTIAIRTTAMKYSLVLSLFSYFLTNFFHLYFVCTLLPYKNRLSSLFNK